MKVEFFVQCFWRTANPEPYEAVIFIFAIT